MPYEWRTRVPRKPLLGVQWRGVNGGYDTVARSLPPGDFGFSGGGDQQSYFFRLQSNSAFILSGVNVKHIVDIVASDLDSPLEAIVKEPHVFGHEIANVQFDHSWLLFSLATDMRRELEPALRLNQTGTYSSRTTVLTVPIIFTRVHSLLQRSVYWAGVLSRLDSASHLAASDFSRSLASGVMCKKLVRGSSAFGSHDQNRANELSPAPATPGCIRAGRHANHLESQHVHWYCSRDW